MLPLPSQCNPVEAGPTRDTIDGSEAPAQAIGHELDSLIAMASAARGQSGLQDFPGLRDAINTARRHLSALAPEEATRNTSAYPIHSFSEPSFNVKMNRQLLLEALYKYPPGVVLEYPLTSANGWVGHLFRVDGDWTNPALDFAYTQGPPKGASKKQNPVFVDVMTDARGNKVPCHVSHSTCQGVKMCEFYSAPDFEYCEASREDLKLRRDQELEFQRASLRPDSALATKTLSYFTALKTHGCRGPVNDDPSLFLTPSVAELRQSVDEGRRGHLAKETCKGQVILDLDRQGNPFLRCEHYNRLGRVDHFVDYAIAKGAYHTDYLLALFLNDRAVIDEVEKSARTAELLTGGCLVVMNSSAVRVNCPFPHRDAVSNDQVIGKMIRKACKCRMRVYQPLEDYRSVCPFVLVICTGAHTHPIPMPLKTPQRVKDVLLSLLQSMDQDLPDMTPRRLMRHPLTKQLLAKEVPGVLNACLSDWHISLSNHDHIRSYISLMQEKCFPHGTGWEGLLNAKRLQDSAHPPSSHYIRSINQLVLDYAHEVPQTSTPASDFTFKVIVCMTPESSRRLLAAQYLQCDIGFKRVAGFLEFELGGMEPHSRTALVYARAFLNCQSAAAHKYLFDKINEIVFLDTGSHLRWNYMHRSSADDITGILQLTVDQHGGQAKGIGLHLRSLAQHLPDQRDLYEPDRLIKDLSEYDHLWRILRLCAVHVHRNIRTSKVSEDVRNLMRSLVCVEHPNWDNTLSEIRRLGGKVGADWIDDKIRSKFAFPGMYWSLSFIPLNVWQAGESNSNIIESLHSDANQEGTMCSLLGGVNRALHFDQRKLKELTNFESVGIRPRLKGASLTESVNRGLKRKADAQHRSFESQDTLIEGHNKRLKTAHDTFIRAQGRLTSATPTTMESAAQGLRRAEAKLRKRVEANVNLASKRRGSGRVRVMLPETGAGRFSGSSTSSM